MVLSVPGKRPFHPIDEMLDIGVSVPEQDIGKDPLAGVQVREKNVGHRQWQVRVCPDLLGEAQSKIECLRVDTGLLEDSWPDTGPRRLLPR